MDGPKGKHPGNGDKSARVSGASSLDIPGLLSLAAGFGAAEDPEVERLLPDRLERIVADFRAHREMEREGPRAGRTKDDLEKIANQAEKLAARLHDATWAVRDAIVAASDGADLDQWLKEGRGSAPGDWNKPRVVRPAPRPLFVEDDVDPSLGDDPPPLWARLAALGRLAAIAARGIPEDRGGKKNVVTWSRGTASGQLVHKVAWLMARHAGFRPEGRGIPLEGILLTTDYGNFYQRCREVYACACPRNEKLKDSQLLWHVREVARLMKEVAELHQQLFDLDKEVEEAERRVLGSPERDVFLAGKFMDLDLHRLAVEIEERTAAYQARKAELRAL